MPWVVEARNGIWLPQVGWHLDARFPARRSFVSHAHADHVANHKTSLCSIPTARLIERRYGKKGGLETLSWGAWRELGQGYRVSLHPAGHVLGSAQWLMEGASGKLLYTGDFKVRPNRSAEPCARLSAEVLVMETTFGREAHSFPPTEEVVGEIEQFCRETLERDRVPVLFAYSLGKSQEVLCQLAGAGFSFMVHPQIATMNEVYASCGIELPVFRHLQLGHAGGHVIVCPPQGSTAEAVRQHDRFRCAFISGWGSHDHARHRFRCERVFPLSDHAGFPELLLFVEAVAPRVVYTVHGFAEDFASTLRRKGMEAWALGRPNQLEIPGLY